MKRSMIKLIGTIFLLCLLILPAAAQNTDADAVYHSLVKEYQLHEDGRITYRHSQDLELLSYYASSRRYGETFIVYDTLNQKLKIEHCETTMASGRVVPSPANAFNDVLPRFAASAPAYNHLRELVVTHTGLENGSRVQLDYQIETKAGFWPALMGDLVLKEDSPVKELLVRVRVPGNKALNYKLFNSDVKAAERIENGVKILEWRFSDLAALHSEKLQPPSGSFAPRLVFSSAADWDEVTGVLNERTAGFSDFNVIPKNIDKNASALDKILAAQKMVVNEMASFPVPLNVTGFRFNGPQQVWKSNGGTPLEKAFLLAGLLGNYGIKAKALLVRPNPIAADDIPSLLGFTKALVCVQPEQHPKMFLSLEKINDKSENYRFAGHSIIAFQENGIKRVKLPKPETDINRCQSKINLVLDGELNYRGKIDVVVQGAANPYLKIQAKAGKADFLLGQWQTEKTQLRRINPELVQVEGTAKGKLGVVEQGDFVAYRLPECGQGIASLHLPDLVLTRNNPLQLPCAGFAESSEYSVEIPETIQLVSPPAAVEKSNTVGKINLSIQKEGNRVIVQRELEISKQRIEPADYPAFLELMRPWKATRFKELILKKD